MRIQLDIQGYQGTGSFTIQTDKGLIQRTAPFTEPYGLLEAIKMLQAEHLAIMADMPETTKTDIAQAVADWEAKGGKIKVIPRVQGKLALSQEDQDDITAILNALDRDELEALVA